LAKHILDYRGAINHYERAIQLDPNMVELHFNIMDLLLRQYEDYEGAKEHYLKVRNHNTKFILPQLDQIFEIND
jgi:tetratricopeptide (TPR) repeat protein